MVRQNSRGSSIGAVRWITSIYFVSGVCSLIDEVVWVRLLKLTLGNTVYATTVVVSVFMGGLALGALIMSRHADRIRDRLRWYVILETVVTVSALAVPALLMLVDRIYVAVFRAYAPSPGALLVIQVLLSAATILVPSVVMGSTLPLLGRYVTSLEREAGRLVGRLYALNTLGAATGCFAAGFVLIRSLGVMGTLYVAAALNLVVAAAGWWLRRGSPGISAESSQPQTEAAPARAGSGPFYLLIVAFFFSGLVSIGYEIGWVRSVMFLVGGDTYVFSSVLTVYLLGNVLGAGLGSRIAPRLRNPAAAFAVTLFALGVSGVLYMPFLRLWSTRLMIDVDHSLAEFASWAPISPTLVDPLLQSMALFLIPSILMGAGFPIALQAWARHVHRVGQSTGAAYGANTIGAVLGGVVTGFLLIPVLGLQWTVSILGLATAWLAAAVYFVFQGGRQSRRRIALPAAALVVTALVAFQPRQLLASIIDSSPWISDALETIDVREGITTTVSVHRNASAGTLNLYSAGQSIAGDTYALRGDQKALGHFGALLHPGAREVLSVGFGSGETTKCLSYHEFERIDCVEIAPEVVETSLRHFGHLNLGEELHDRVNMIYMDAKNFLHLTDRRYDLIVNDSIHPRDFSENASLYAKEYFESARERLRDGGMFVSWLPTYHVSIAMFDSILGTLVDVFPHVSAWYLTQNPAPLLVLLATDDPQLYDPRPIDRALEDPRIRESLELIGIRSGMDLLNCFVGDERDLRLRIPRHAVNSDYTPFVEFNVDAWAWQPDIFRHFVVEVRSDSIFEHIVPGMDEAWMAGFRARHQAAQHVFQARISDNELEKLRLYTAALSLVPEDPAMLETIRGSEAILLQKGISVMNGAGIDRAMELADLILKIYPRSCTAWLLRSRVMQVRGDWDNALFAARAAATVDPDNVEARENLRRVVERAQSAAADATSDPAVTPP